ncbi:MAG: hypothetical protein ABEJ22_04995 [Haloferacaceae archaeon]
MMSDETNLTEEERQALHEIEVGTEWFHRAHGHLVAFHHAVGHGMDHLEAARRSLRAAGHDELASDLRTDLLPRGVVDDRWSYDLLESFQAGLLADVLDYEELSRERLADGERHVAERAQERAWRDRSRDR